MTFSDSSLMQDVHTYAPWRLRLSSCFGVYSLSYFQLVQAQERSSPFVAADKLNMSKIQFGCVYYI